MTPARQAHHARRMTLHGRESCVLPPPTLGAKLADTIRKRGGKRAFTGEQKETVKTIAQECRLIGVIVVLYAVLFLLHRRTGATRIRIPCPSLFFRCLRSNNRTHCAAECVFCSDVIASQRVARRAPDDRLRGRFHRGWIAAGLRQTEVAKTTHP